MATKQASRRSKSKAAPLRKNGETFNLEVLKERLPDTRNWTDVNWSKFNQRFSSKKWVVYTPGDAFSHYISVMGNLTGSVNEPSEPAFQFIRSRLKEGLPRGAFDRIKDAIATTTEELSSITEISTRTVARRKRFKPDESDRLLRVASAFQKALELFEDLEKARKWFTTSKAALAGFSPIECCDTETGCKEVENLLGRIDESVYS